MIKYQYAYNSKGEITHVDTVEREESKAKELFVCISCGNELIPRLGKIRKRHFTHKELINCSGETYLHNLGKKLFYQEYNFCVENNKPFYIEFYKKMICNKYESELKVVCNLGKETSKFNLTEYFTDITLEKREGSFIPDVMLISKNGKEKIFIEIAVTHFSSELKISSDYRIIELEVEDETDLEVIKQHLISVNYPKVKFKNFRIKEITGHHCDNNCMNPFNLFVVTPDGKSRIFEWSLTEISNYLQREVLIFYEITTNEDYNYSTKYKWSVARAYASKVNIKNCFICRYHAQNKTMDASKNPIFCKFLRIICNSNEAAICKYFMPDKKQIDEYISHGDFVYKKSNKFFTL